MLKRKLVLENETILFILLNFGDLLLTGIVFSRGGVELNPIARWVIHYTGSTGLVYYKFLLMTFVILACQHVYLRRPQLARGILLFGSAVYAVVVLTSFAQIIMHLPHRL